MKEDDIQVAADFLQDLFQIEREGLVEGLRILLTNPKEALGRLNAPVAQVVNYNAERDYSYEPVYELGNFNPVSITPNPRPLLTNVTLRVPNAPFGERPKYLFIPLVPR